jgi:serpin B
MTTDHPHPLTRRTLITRTAAIASLAAILHSRTQSLSAQASPETQDDTLPELVAGNTAFALDLYNELRKNADGNLLFSPYSVSLALAMTFAGARGNTATQMADSLSFSLPEPALHDALGVLTDDLLTRGDVKPDPERGGGENGLRIANALWGEQAYPFSAAFIAQLEDSYGAGLEQTDFINAPEDSRDDINTWVEEQTEDRIQDIVPEGAITSLTRLVLANAIYFYGSWLHSFDPMATNEEPFHLLDGETVDVFFMYQEQDLAYATIDGMQLVSLPYVSAGLTMTIILPDEGELDAFEDGLDVDTLEAALDDLHLTPLYLWLPTFEFDFSASLAGTLRSLGMTDPFDPDRADFTGMMDMEDGEAPQDNLVISDVLHKAFISVDEDGTEAAAATVVMVGATSAAPEDKPRPIEVRIDRPFLFTIRDTETGTILFLGRVLDPSL